LFHISVCFKSLASQVLLRRSKEMDIAGLNQTANWTCDWLQCCWGEVTDHLPCSPDLSPTLSFLVWPLSTIQYMHRGSFLHLIMLNNTNTLGSTSLEKRSAHHEGLYLTKSNTDKRPVPPVGFKYAIPASQRLQIYPHTQSLCQNFNRIHCCYLLCSLNRAK